MAAVVVVPATLSGEPMPQLRLARQSQLRLARQTQTVPTGILGHRVRSELVARNFGAATGMSFPTPEIREAQHNHFWVMCDTVVK